MILRSRQRATKPRCTQTDTSTVPLDLVGRPSMRTPEIYDVLGHSTVADESITLRHFQTYTLAQIVCLGCPGLRLILIN
jgi:hypothetical protein